MNNYRKQRLINDKSGFVKKRVKFTTKTALLLIFGLIAETKAMKTSVIKNYNKLLFSKISKYGFLTK